MTFQLNGCALLLAVVASTLLVIDACGGVAPDTACDDNRADPNVTASDDGAGPSTARSDEVDPSVPRQPARPRMKIASYMDLPPGVCHYAQDDLYLCLEHPNGHGFFKDLWNSVDRILGRDPEWVREIHERRRPDPTPTARYEPELVTGYKPSPYARSGESFLSRLPVVGTLLQRPPEVLRCAHCLFSCATPQCFRRHIIRSHPDKINDAKACQPIASRT